MGKNNLIAFIASYNNDFGAKIIDFYPKSIRFDLEHLATQILLAFQSFYYSENDEKEEEKKIKRTFFKLPIKNINRKARIFLDLIKDYDGKDKTQPLVLVGFLFPDYLSDIELEQYDELIYNIGTEYIKIKKSLLKKHFKKIYELFLLKEKIADAEILIDENYSFNDGLLDFKKGIEQFSKKKYEQAYFLFKKANLKFNAEKNIKLILETSFFIGSVLSQLNKIKAAQEYFEKLETLSNQLQHQKYYETAIFMNGFCAFKAENYEKALNQFKKLEFKEIQFINKFKFYFLYGRVLRLLGLNEKAIEMFLRAREVSNEIEESDIFKEKRAKLFLEVGHTHYNMAIETAKNGKADQTTLKSYLQKTINYYEDCAKIWEDLNNYNGLINIYQLIGDVHEVLNQLNQSIGYYRKALKYAELINDILSRLHIFNLIIQVLERLELHDVIVKEIDEMLSKIKIYAFIDLFTISGFHRQLGRALFKLGRKKEALSELLISMNIYNNFETPIIDSLDTLQNIIEIYKSSEEDKYVQYYQEQYNQLQEKIQAAEIKEKNDFGILGELKELWILYEDGTTLFSYAPETKFDPNLFGGFLTALQSFSWELTSEYMDSMTMGLDQYTFYREENCNIFIMGRSSVKTSINLVTESLKTIYKEFLNEYEKFLEKFDGFVGRFSNFIKWIENS